MPTEDIIPLMRSCYNELKRRNLSTEFILCAMMFSQESNKLENVNNSLESIFLKDSKQKIKVKRDDKYG